MVEIPFSGDADKMSYKIDTFMWYKMFKLNSININQLKL